MTPAPAPPRALLLDLDNTLADRDAAMERWLATLVPAEEIPRLVAIGLGGYAPKGPFFRAVGEAVGGAEGAALPVAEVRRRFEEDFPTFYTVRPDADVLLRAFTGPKVLVTNGWSKLQRNKIAALGLGDRVDHVLISGEVGAEKPDPAIFRMALTRAGVSPAEALMIGDHPLKDVAGAQAVGIPAVFVRSPWFTAPEGVLAVDLLTELPFLAPAPARRRR